MSEKQVLYGFWNYDICPYMLGGIIDRFTKTGNIIVRGYCSMSFKPIAILPDEVGKTALLELKKLESEAREAERHLKRGYQNAARKLVGLPIIEWKK